MNHKQTDYRARRSGALPQAGCSCGSHCWSATAGRAKLLCILGLILLTGLTGCRGPNHFMAESLPKNLRLTSQRNAQEVNFSRLASVTGGSEIIGPGDVLEVSIAAGLGTNDKVDLPIRVANDGSGSLPGDDITFQLAGYAPEAAESLIRMELIRRGLYLNPSVTVTVKQMRKNRIRVLGAVKAEGTYELPPNSSDVVSAIAAAGGLAENAGTKVEIRNPSVPTVTPRPAVAGNPESPYSSVSSTSTTEVSEPTHNNSYTIDLISAAKSGDGSYLVQDGGVIMVEKRDPPPVTVTGLVRKADQYPFPFGKDLTVLEAIAMAGGPSNQLADKVYVIRPLSNSHDPAVIQLSMREAKKSGNSNIKLGPGDVVSVEQTPATVLMEMLQIIRFGVNSSVGLF